MMQPKELSLTRWAEASVTEGGYPAPPGLQKGSRGHIVPPHAEIVTDDPALISGGRFLKVIDALRPPLSLAAAGADVREGVGRSVNVLGVVSAGVEAGYLVDGQEAINQKFSTGTVWLGDAIVTARVPISNRFMYQADGGAAEQLVRRHLARAMKSRTERAVLAGPGVHGDPKGLIETDDLPATTGAVSKASILADVQSVLDEGADPELVSVFASSGDFTKLVDSDQPAHGTTGALHQVGGIGVRFTPYLAEGDAITGDFSMLSVVYHEKPEIMVNPFTQAASGQIIVQGWQMTGWGVVQVNAFLRRRAA